MIFFALIGCAFQSHAQNLRIQSRVLDGEDKQPLWGASVLVKGSSKGSFTDKTGEFQFSNLNPSDSLSIRFVGYEPKVFRADEIPQVLYLDKQTVLNDEVVVNALMATNFSGMAFTNVKKEDLEKQNLGQDIPILLNLLPSMVTTSDAGAGIGYTGLKIRGTDPTRINVTINGIPLNDSESQGLYWVNMPDMASSVSNIQIQRGVGTSTNGAAAFGGSVHVNTNTYEPKRYAEIASSGGSFGTLKNTLKFGTGLLKNRWTVDLRLSKIQSNGYVDRASADLKSLYSTIGYFGKKSIYRLNYFMGKEITYQSWYGTPESRVKNDLAGMTAYAERNYLSDADKENLFNAGRTYNFYTYENQIDHYAQDHVQFLSHHQLNANWDMDLNLHYTYGRGYYEEYILYPNLLEYGIYTKIYIENLVRRKWLDNDFYGTTFNFHYDNRKGLDWVIGGAVNQYDGRHFGRIVRSEPNFIQDFQWYHSLAYKQDKNLYSKINIALNNQLTGFLDLQIRGINYNMKGNQAKRIDFDFQNKYLFFNPKIGANYQLGESARLYGSFARGAKEPSRQDFIDNLGKAPRPEKLSDFEWGYEVNTKKIRFQANAYWMQYRDQLVLTGRLNNVGEAIRENVDQSFRRGIELVGGIQISKKIAWQGNLTLSRNKIANYKEVVVDYGTGESIEITHKNADIAMSPSVIAASQVKYVLGSMEMDLNSKFVGAQYLDNTSSADRKLPAYFTTDLFIQKKLNWKFAKESRINLQINNIFNSLYSSNGYTWGYFYYGKRTIENFLYPQAGINFLVGVNFRI